MSNQKPTESAITRQQATALILQASVRNGWAFPTELRFWDGDSVKAEFDSIAEMQPWAEFFGAHLGAETGHPTVPGTFQRGHTFGWHGCYVSVGAHDEHRPFGVPSPPSELAALTDELVAAVQS